ncbi:hypothetical protein PFISCL1PPCAC_13115, partial [Pristionchus fissidentatus]
SDLSADIDSARAAWSVRVFNDHWLTDTGYQQLRFLLSIDARDRPHCSAHFDDTELPRTIRIVSYTRVASLLYRIQQ